MLHVRFPRTPKGTRAWRPCRRFLRAIGGAVLALGVAAAAPVHAGAEAAAQPPARSAGAAREPGNAVAAAFAGHWRSIGPFRGGRSTAVAGSAARTREYYQGTTGGGVFKTTNGGLSWFPVTDGFFGGSIGAIAVNDSNPDIVYVGTGERSLRGDVSPGDGLYRSTDAGRRWARIGFADSRHIARVRLHPRNPDIALVAVFGHVFGPHAERGVYRTTDAGQHWQRTLFRDDSTGAMELELDPNDPQIVYATLWDMQRKSWLLKSGGPGSGLFKSTNGGETWSEITRNPGLPQGVVGKIGVAPSRARRNRVWAVIEAADGGLFRSDDAGATWARISSDPEFRRRPWYFSHLAADPADSNTVYYLGIPLIRSGMAAGRSRPSRHRTPITTICGSHRMTRHA